MKLRLRPHPKKRSSRQPDEPLRSRLLRRMLRLAWKRKRKLAVTNRYEVGMVISEIATVLYLMGSIMMLLRSGLRGSYWFRLKSLENVENKEAGPEEDWTR
ncbi:hypothetical protein [Paenibacillus lautus]|uniref:hypothetical protein n=1 Tax=Paenibacillus lautus TaxID=1401 RepID=UPI000FD7F9BE|nr:hypothetical protein [Paenibacillus lautus]